MKEELARTDLLTKTLIHEIAKAPGLPQIQLAQAVKDISPTGPSNRTETTKDREQMLQTITQSAHNGLRSHMGPTLSHVASDSLR